MIPDSLAITTQVIAALSRGGVPHVELGREFSLDPQTSCETNTGTFRHVLIHRQTEFKTELFLLSPDAYDQERFNRRQAMNFNGQPTFVLTAEDVIVTKLRWLRPKDVEEIRDVIAVNLASLDGDYIHRWTAIHATRAKLDEIRATVPVID